MRNGALVRSVWHVTALSAGVKFWYKKFLIRPSKLDENTHTRSRLEDNGNGGLSVKWVDHGSRSSISGQGLVFCRECRVLLTAVSLGVVVSPVMEVQQNA